MNGVAVPIPPDFASRRAKRIPVSAPVAILVKSEGNKHKRREKFIDLSELGLKLKAEIALIPGQMTEVLFDITTKDPVPSRIVWAGEAGSTQEGEAGLKVVQLGD